MVTATSQKTKSLSIPVSALESGVERGSDKSYNDSNSFHTNSKIVSHL